MDQLLLTADDTRFFAPRDWIDESVRPRITGERWVVRVLAETLLAEGFSLRVWEGEDWACALTTDLDVVMDNIMSTDEDTLYVYKGNGEDKPKRIGCVLFVYGNMANEVVNDYSVALEPYMKPADDVMEKLLEMNL